MTLFPLYYTTLLIAFSNSTITMTTPDAPSLIIVEISFLLLLMLSVVVVMCLHYEVHYQVDCGIINYMYLGNT